MSDEIIQLEDELATAREENAVRAAAQAEEYQRKEDEIRIAELKAEIEHTKRLGLPGSATDEALAKVAAENEAAEKKASPTPAAPKQLDTSAVENSASNG
jgi:hypothetical protein